MVRDSMETETLARLYLDQGHPERAAPIFERILLEDPGCLSAAEGLERCRAAIKGRVAEDGMDREKKLEFLKRLLSRLTGESPEEEPQVAVSEEVSAPEIQPPPVVEEVKASPPPIPAKPADPRQRKLELLQAMLQRLTEA